MNEYAEAAYAYCAATLAYAAAVRAAVPHGAFDTDIPYAAERDAYMAARAAYDVACRRLEENPPKGRDAVAETPFQNELIWC